MQFCCLSRAVSMTMGFNRFILEKIRNSQTTNRASGSLLLDFCGKIFQRLLLGNGFTLKLYNNKEKSKSRTIKNLFQKFNKNHYILKSDKILELPTILNLNKKESKAKSSEIKSLKNHIYVQNLRMNLNFYLHYRPEKRN